MLLGQQVIIENRGGAGGMIGTRDAAKAPPDGYTLVMMLTGISLSPNTGYDVNKDFAPIGTVASTPMIVEPTRRFRRSRWRTSSRSPRKIRENIPSARRRRRR